MGPSRQLRRVAQIFRGLGRRNLFWGLYRDLYQGHLTNADVLARLPELLRRLQPGGTGTTAGRGAERTR